MLHSSEVCFQKEALEVRKLSIDVRSKKINKTKSKVYKTERLSSESSQKTLEKSDDKILDSPASSAQSYSTSDVTPFLKIGKKLRNKQRFKNFRLNSLLKFSQKRKRVPSINQVFQHFESFITPLKEKLKTVSVSQLTPSIIDKLVDEMKLENEPINHEAQLQKMKMLAQFQEKDLETHLNNQYKETQDIQKYKEYCHYMTFRNYYYQKNQELILSKKSLMLFEQAGHLPIQKGFQTPKQAVAVPGSEKKMHDIQIENESLNSKLSVIAVKEEDNSMNTQQKLLILPNYVMNNSHIIGDANSFQMNENFIYHSPIVFRHKAAVQTDTETIVGTVRRDSLILSEQLDTVPMMNSKPEMDASNDYFRKRVFSSNKLEDITDLLIDGEEKVYDGDKLFCLHDNYSQNNSEPIIKGEECEFRVKEEEPCHIIRDFNVGICNDSAIQFIDL